MFNLLTHVEAVSLILYTSHFDGAPPSRVASYRTARALRGARITSGARITDTTPETADMVADSTAVQIKKYNDYAQKP